MNIKAVSTGFIIGIIANITGVILYIQFFSKLGIEETLKNAWIQGFFGSLVALGAVLNLLVFFLFLKQNKIYEARGTLLATVLAAILILMSKF